MTILVDRAIWPWRDDRWAHLVSDESHQELHEFATSIGKLRVSFQGDHYDVRSAERDLALSAGARAVDSRDLVRAIRAAGLRRRPSDPAIDWTWHQRDVVPAASELHAALGKVFHHPDGRNLAEVTMSVLEGAGLTGPMRLTTLLGTRDLAIVVSAPVAAWQREPMVEGLDVYEAYTSRADGTLSVELLSGPGTPG